MKEKSKRIWSRRSRLSPTTSQPHASYLKMDSDGAGPSTSVVLLHQKPKKSSDRSTKRPKAAGASSKDRKEDLDALEASALSYVRLSSFALRLLKSYELIPSAFVRSLGSTGESERLQRASNLGEDQERFFLSPFAFRRPRP
jgi:hypothetical protein